MHANPRVPVAKGRGGSTLHAKGRRGEAREPLPQPPAHLHPGPPPTAAATALTLGAISGPNPAQLQQDTPPFFPEPLVTAGGVEHLGEGCGAHVLAVVAWGLRGMAEPGYGGRRWRNEPPVGGGTWGTGP